MSRRGSQVWYNGKILPVDEARISLFTHGLHYGTGAFEGIRAYKQKSGGGAVFRLREHMQRFIESAKIMGFTAPYDLDTLVRAATEVCKANGFEECYIRPILFIADGPLGVNPGNTPPIDVAILTWEWGSYLGDKGIEEGAKLCISSYVRPHVNSSMTKGKISGQYVNSVLAKREALAHGYDEALLLDPEGYLTEGSGENLFMIRNGRVKTTPLNSILNGITRSTVLEYFERKGIPVEAARFTRDEIYCADEVFMTGTAAEITPIQSIDRRIIGAGKPGPLTREVQGWYQSVVHGDDIPAWAQAWLTRI